MRQGRREPGAGLGLNNLPHVLGHAALILGIQELGRQEDRLLRGELELLVQVALFLEGRLHGVLIATAASVGNFFLDLRDLLFQQRVDRRVVHERVLAASLCRHRQPGERRVHLRMNRPRILLALGTERVAVDAVAEHVVNGAELLVLVQSRFGIDIVQELVGIAALEDVEVIVVVQVVQHVLAGGVVALAGAVERHAERQRLKLLRRFRGHLPVCPREKLIVIRRARLLDNLRHHARVGVEDGGLVLRRALHGLGERAPDGRLFGQAAVEIRRDQIAPMHIAHIVARNAMGGRLYSGCLPRRR